MNARGPSSPKSSYISISSGCRIQFTADGQVALVIFSVALTGVAEPDSFWSAIFDNIEQGETVSTHSGHQIGAIPL